MNIKKFYTLLIIIFICISISFSISPTSIEIHSSIKSLNDTTNDNGLIGYWDCNELEGIILHDRTDNLNHGSIYNASWCNGISGNALYFNGENDYVEIQHNDNLNLDNQSFTISFCIKTNSTDFSVPIEKDLPHSKNPAWFVYFLESGKLKFYVGDSNEDKSVTSQRSINNDFWHHIVLIRDSNENLIKIYIDGELDSYSLGPFGSVSNVVDIFIGATYYDYSHMKDYFKGFIDEIRIYNRALDNKEIKNLYFSYFTTSFIVGKINDLRVMNESITFHAENIFAINKHYNSEEKIMILNSYIGIITPKIIFGIFRMILI